MYVPGVMAVVCWEKEQKHTHIQKKSTGCISLLSLVQSEEWRGWKKQKEL